MKTAVGALLVASAAAERCALMEKKTVMLQGMGRNPGAGMDLPKLKEEVGQKAYKDGYFHVKCMNEGMQKWADKHGMQGSKRYAAQNVNVSVVWYNDLVAKEDRKDMTPEVCYSTCRTVKDMHFFGISNGCGLDAQ